MLRLDTIGEYRQWRAERKSGPCVAVYTMGALHQGHAELARRARHLAGSEGTVVATIFVNPTQFDNAEDLARYPRTLAADSELLEGCGVDVLLVPAATEMYPDGGQVTIDPGPLGRVLEGQSRPGHFAGVLTVVAKLLHITRPDIAVFGEKDYQQLTLIRRMASDLDFPVAIVGVPTVRDETGLALSSRNAHLSPSARRKAAGLSEVLAGIRAGLAAGQPLQRVVNAGHARLHELGVTDVDYLVVTGNDLDPVPISGSGRVLVAATIDGVRLIDNMEVEL